LLAELLKPAGEVLIRRALAGSGTSTKALNAKVIFWCSVLGMNLIFIPIGKMQLLENRYAPILTHYTYKHFSCQKLNIINIKEVAGIQLFEIRRSVIFFDMYQT
jgi:hypothetical protein